MVSCIRDFYVFLSFFLFFFFSGSCSFSVAAIFHRSAAGWGCSRKRAPSASLELERKSEWRLIAGGGGNR